MNIQYQLDVLNVHYNALLVLRMVMYLLCVYVCNMYVCGMYDV